jgi:hypothetical protein
LIACKLFTESQNRTSTAAESSPENGNKVEKIITGRTESQILFSDPDTHKNYVCNYAFIMHTS